MLTRERAGNSQSVFVHRYGRKRPRCNAVLSPFGYLVLVGPICGLWWNFSSYRTFGSSGALRCPLGPQHLPLACYLFTQTSVHILDVTSGETTSIQHKGICLPPAIIHAPLGGFPAVLGLASSSTSSCASHYLPNSRILLERIVQPHRVLPPARHVEENNERC